MHSHEEEERSSVDYIHNYDFTLQLSYGPVCCTLLQFFRRKRKRVVLSLENKLSILNRLAKGEKGTKVTSEFGIGNSTVTDLKKNESRIRSLVSSMESLFVRSKVRKIIRLADDEKVDEDVYKFISENFTYHGVP